MELARKAAIGEFEHFEDLPPKESYAQVVEILSQALNNEAGIVRYHCGTQARVGDVVDLDGMASVVDSVIVTKEELVLWDVDQPGLMFKTDSMGLVFQNQDSPCWPEVTFIRRRSNTES